MGLAVRKDATIELAGANPGAPLMGAPRELPAWITAAPQFVTLRAGARATLLAIAAACRSSGADGSLLYAEGGVELARAAGISLRTLWRHIERLEALGFVVTIGRGGVFNGRSLPNSYGIPGSCGALSGRRRKREVRYMVDGRPQAIAPGAQAPLWGMEPPEPPESPPESGGHPCQIVTPNGCKACQNGTRPERSERGKGVCKACQNGTLHGYGFKTQNHDHGFEARAALHGPGENPRRGAGDQESGGRYQARGRWFRAERGDLADDRLTLELLADARRAGFVGPGEREALKFLAAVEHARRVGDAPERLLGAIVRRGQWLYIGEADEDAARERLRRMRSAHEERAVEQAGRMVGVSPAVAAELIKRCRARMGGLS
jgi:hypothetical protein